MADDELDLDAKQPSNRKRWLLLILGALLLVGGSIGGTLLLVGGAGGPETPTEPARPSPRYLPLESMVVNFGPGGPARYLQVEMQVMAFDEASLAAVENHMPVVRNNILMILGSQSFESVTTREGKEQLRGEILESINQIIREQEALEAGIESVYFTSFVMQ